MAKDLQKKDPGVVIGSLAEIVRQLRLVFRLLGDQQVSTLIKAIPVIALLYVLSPIDILPDLALGLGQLDDLAIILLGLKLFVELSPPEIVRQHLENLGVAPDDAQAPEEEEEDQGEVIEGSYRVVDDD